MQESGKNDICLVVQALFCTLPFTSCKFILQPLPPWIWKMLGQLLLHNY